MKISRQTLVLIVLAVVSFSFAYVASRLSRSYEAEKERQSRAKGELAFYHGPREMNYWDFGGISLIVIGSSCGLSAMWLRNR